MRPFGWFRDRAVRRIVRLGVPVVLGKAVGSASSLVTLALLARYVSVKEFGVIAMIRTVVSIIDQYANFNTWQAIVTFGTQAIAAKRPTDVRAVIKLSFLIDLGTGFAGAIVAAGMAVVIPGAFDWDNRDALLFVVYACSLIFRIAGTSDGIYRICDAYRAQAIASSISAVVTVSAIIIAIVLETGPSGVIVAMMAGESVGNLLVATVSFWVARQHDLGGWLGESLVGVRTRLPGVTRFLFATNGQLTVRKTQSELDMILVGAMLGRVPSGLFRVVKQLGTIPGRIFMPFEQVLFTELARAAAARDYPTFRSLMRKAVALLGLGALAIWLVAAVFAEPLIRVVAGADYVVGASAFRWYLLAMVVLIASAPIQRAMIALGRPGTLFWFEVATLIVLVIAAIIGARGWGIEGVSVAVLLHKIVQIAWVSQLVHRVIVAQERGELPPPTGEIIG